jgi:hypothetical protein
MHTTNYVDVNDLDDVPTFDDAELIDIAYRPTLKKGLSL